MKHFGARSTVMLLSVRVMRALIGEASGRKFCELVANSVVAVGLLATLGCQVSPIDASVRSTSASSARPPVFALGVEAAVSTRSNSGDRGEVRVSVTDWSFESSYQGVTGNTVEPDTGAQFLMVRVRARNTGSNRTLSPAFRATVAGTVINRCAIPIGDRPAYYPMELNPGAVRDGWQCHTVSSVQQPAEVIVSASQDGVESARWVIRLVRNEPESPPLSRAGSSAENES